MRNSIGKKEYIVRQLISKLQGAVVAFSGGVDSTLLLKLTRETLRDRVWAITVHSPIYNSALLSEANQIAKRLRVKHKIIKGKELMDPYFCQNNSKRCYVCKTSFYSEMRIVAQKNGLQALLDGSNAEDPLNYRPGLKAAEQAQVISPLKLAGLTKTEIRQLARNLNLPNWNKPASPCLCTRIPYGETITLEKLQQIDKAEKFLRKLGYLEFRVRHHGQIARIEVLPQEFDLLLKQKSEISSYFKELGFFYVAVDLDGFRIGSMNESLPHEPV